jgi:predicted extracellular nuclease
MWVQTNPTAAPNEGIYVFGDGSSVAAFQPGTRVNIIGRVSEFNDMSGTETLTELNAISIEAGTAGTTPIVPLTGKNVTELSAEQYESTLVTLTNVKVKTVGTTSGANQTFGVGDADQYTSPGNAVTFKTDDDMYLFTPASTCYSSVTGIWTYLSRNDAWGFLPMAAGTIGTTCQ